ncbi:9927_t:CDS:2 [Paraglomus occultum]|uniref:9927_t:CDS:1 n=1 Tax=Paraglomus occultum TaxID=144539 RepID=A0A9N9C5T6_9GLOM|nr:9927_t:CDS:2 [Paraglomus occultum]
MTTRYAQASTGSPVGVSDDANDNQGERYESPVLLTGTSTPAAGIGSWVSLSPNIHTSDSELEAYQADNDDDLISDSPVEDQEERPRGVLNLPRNIEVEQEEALRASLSTILASSERPRFRQARERELRARTANRFRTLATKATNPPPLFFSRDTSPHFNSTSAVTNDTTINPVLDRDLSDSQCNLTSSDTSSSTTHKFVQPIIHHRTSVRHSRGSMSPPFQDKAEAMIERSFNISHSPRIVYSAPSSPPTTSFLETSDQLTKSDEEEEQEGYVSESKSRRRNLNRAKYEEDGQSNSTSEYESVSSLSLDEISDVSRSGRKSWKKESGHSVDGSSDDGSKWYSGDITVKVWTAAVISGVLLGAGFGAGSLWRGSRAGHYTAAPA